MPREGRILFNANSKLARVTDLQSRRFGAEVGAAQIGVGAPMYFLVGSLLIDLKHQETVDIVTREYGGRIVDLSEIPSAPPGLIERSRGQLEKLPRVAQVTVDLDRAADDIDLIHKVFGSVERISSERAASTLALFASLVTRGHEVSLDYIGRSSTLPMQSAVESTGDAFHNGQLQGLSRLSKAWQLMQARWEIIDPTQAVLSICDIGFDIHSVNVAPDLANIATTYHLRNDNTHIDGRNEREEDKPWHGTWVLSAAAAIVANGKGAAGSAGVQPRQNGFTSASTNNVFLALFRAHLLLSDFYRSLTLAIAWGIDVINYSWEVAIPVAFTPAWYTEMFQFAFDQGVIVIAAAGNDGSELPNGTTYPILPATRTPGVITVGATGLNTAGFHDALETSNYGSSVDIWAPGGSIPTLDPAFATGVTTSGTSIASPIVAGIVTLMKTIKPTVGPSEAKSILRATATNNGRTGSRANHIMDAYAALLATMGGRLPRGRVGQNADQASAEKLSPGKKGKFSPIGPTAVPNVHEQTWYSLDVKEFSALAASVRFNPDLGVVGFDIVPADETNRIEQDVVSSSIIVPGGATTRTKVAQIVSPGRYFIRVSSSEPNLFELNGTLLPKPLEPDQFEANNTRQTAHEIDCSPAGTLANALRIVTRKGTYDANIQTAADVDWYHVTHIREFPLTETWFRLDYSDLPLKLEAFDQNNIKIQETPLVRTGFVVLPAPEAWIKVSSPSATRYTFTVLEHVNEKAKPGPLISDDIMLIPIWIPDPQEFKLGQETVVEFELTEEEIALGSLTLSATVPAVAEILDQSALPTGVAAKLGEGRLSAKMAVAHLAPGRYFARIKSTGPSVSAKYPSTAGRFKIGSSW